MGFDGWTRKQAQRLAQTITMQHDEAAHSACLDALEEYITAQLNQQAYLRLFPQVAQHLDSCVTCAEAYAVVYETRVAEATAFESIAVPEPVLDFLRLSPVDQLQRKLASAVERLAPHRFRFSLSQTLLDLLLPAQPSQFAFRSAATDAPLLDVTVDHVFADEIQIQLSVYQQRDAQDRCTVRARLGVAEREWPDLADIPVTLMMGGQQRHAQTDAWGEAVFDNVPKEDLAGIQIEIDVDDAPQTRT
jgi:hypothetical protein